MNDQYKPYPDCGNLHASSSKRYEKSPDYWGEIAFNIKDMTNIRMEDGLAIIKIGGWKKVGPSGKTYLSLKVDRFIPQPNEQAPQAPAPKSGFEDMDSDIPF